MIKYKMYFEISKKDLYFIISGLYVNDMLQNVLMP